MRKNPDGKNPLISPVPLVIAPTTEGSYQLPALGYLLDFGEVVQVSDCLFLLLDPAKAVRDAQLTQFTKSLLKKHGVKPKDAGSGGTQ